jgi:hypothetical protein
MLVTAWSAIPGAQQESRERRGGSGTRPNLHEQVALLRAQIAQLTTQIQFANRRLSDMPTPGAGGILCGDPCATDSDGDGFGDCEDLCPCDPSQVDADGDLVPDCADPCPGDPGNACIDPCRTDSDGDGANDCEDPCAYDPAPPEDHDGDGLPECLDPCPDDPANNCVDPCGLDQDGDGLPDCSDNCPWAAGDPATGTGTNTCPVPSGVTAGAR